MQTWQILSWLKYFSHKSKTLYSLYYKWIKSLYSKAKAAALVVHRKTPFTLQHMIWSGNDVNVLSHYWTHTLHTKRREPQPFLWSHWTLWCPVNTIHLNFKNTPTHHQLNEMNEWMNETNGKKNHLLSITDWIQASSPKANKNVVCHYYEREQII